MRNCSIMAFVFSLNLTLSIPNLLAEPNELSPLQVLRLGNGTEPKELDPATITGVPESHIVDNLFEGLTSLDPFTLDPMPGVALSWSVSEDGKEYVFTLRKDARWSDGRRITAEDFVWSWQRVLAPETASEYAYQLYYLKNGRAFNEGKIKDPKKLGVSAKNDHTLVVHLENPTPYFLRLTAFHTLFPTPKHILMKTGKETFGSIDQSWTRPGSMVSNGPFIMTEWKINQYVKLERNPHYWDRSVVKLKEAYFFAIENADTEERTFNAGDLHMTSTVPNIKIPKYERMRKRDQAKSVYQANPSLGVYYYRFNVTKEPTNRLEVRKALAMTVDRKLLVERVTKGGQIAATNFTPPVSGYQYQGDLPVSVSPQVCSQAKTLLAKAYPDIKKMPPIDILYNTSEGHKKIAIAIQQMWSRCLKVKVRLHNQEWKVYLDSQRKLNYTISRAGWIGDYPDPNTFLDMFVTGGGNNQTGWAHKDYDRAIELASQTKDQAKRYQYFTRAETILMSELPVLPIYFYTQNRLVSRKVKMFDAQGKVHNWTSNISDRWMLKYYALSK